MDRFSPVLRPESKPSPGWRRWDQRAHQASVRLDERLRGRLPRVLASVAALSAGSAPLLEFTLGSQGGAASLGSWLAAACLGLLGWLWLGRARAADGALQFELLRRRSAAALRLLSRDLQELPSAPKLLKLLILGRLILGLGLWGIGAGSLGRAASACFGEVPSPRWLGLQLLGCSLLGLSALLGWARRAHARREPVDVSECQLAAREFPAVVDLASPVELDSLFLEPTLLHRILEALARWGDAGWPNEGAYAQALQRHLQRHLPDSRIESECWLGETRADGIAALVIDDTVLIEVQRGFGARRAGAAIEQVKACTRQWQEKPIVLVIFDAGSAEVLEGAANRSLENLHESGAFVAARMPTSALCRESTAPGSSVRAPAA